MDELRGMERQQPQHEALRAMLAEQADGSN